MLVIEYSQKAVFGVEFDIKILGRTFSSSAQQLQDRFNKLYPGKVRTILYKGNGGYIKLVIETNIEECSEVVKTVKLVALLDKLTII
jgi:hypothetical protein